MPRKVLTPPPHVMFNAWVSHYARIGKGLRFSGRSRAYMEDTEVGRVPCLAIARSFSDRSVLLLHCGPTWHIRGLSSHSSVREAKAGAERSYPGIRSHWIATGQSLSMARRRRRELWANETCSFCGAIPPDISALIQRRSVAICDVCVRECFEIISHGQSASTA